jgi:hypothetical protein
MKDFLSMVQQPISGLFVPLGVFPEVGWGGL